MTTISTTVPHRFSEDLNFSQYAAVTHPGGPLLVLAGPGTGKTRVLTYRVGWLLDQGVPSSAILMATFSCTAAQEMLTRALKLGGRSLKRHVSLFGGTFHSLACRFLRQYGPQIGLSSKFVILDRHEAEGIIAQLRASYPSKDRLPSKADILNVISSAANRMLPVEQISSRPPAPSGFYSLMAEQYAAFKLDHSLLDFDDLLLFLHRLLSESETASEKITSQFQHVLVDEYQDVNKLQAEIVRLLAPHGNISAVGDDAQAVYAFRGADSEAILRFPEDYPGCTVHTLRHNYRSTKSLVAFSNAIIPGKNLYTDNAQGQPPLLFHALNDADEARWVTDQILILTEEEDFKPSEIAVLFRSDHCAAKLEMELTGRGIPFRKRGGKKKVAETAHFKDALAFFRLLLNPHDRLAWLRLFLQLDKVGQKTASDLADRVLSSDDPFSALSTVQLPVAAEGLARLKALIDSIRSMKRTRDIAEQVIPYILLFYARKHPDDYVKRERGLDQLARLISGYTDFQMLVDDLSCDPSEEKPENGAVSVFTVHASKCKEYRAVFMIGLAHGLFPDFRVTREQMPEERRLFYVGATRPVERLYLSWPAKIMTADRKTVQSMMSPFLQGINPKLYQTDCVPMPFLSAVPPRHQSQTANIVPF